MFAYTGENDESAMTLPLLLKGVMGSAGNVRFWNMTIIDIKHPRPSPHSGLKT
jgi:hypothetical protein